MQNYHRYDKFVQILFVNLILQAKYITLYIENLGRGSIFYNNKWIIRIQCTAAVDISTE